MADSNIPHEIEDRFRNIEAHLGIGHVDEETGKYSTETHESLVPAEPDAPATESAPAPKSVAELEAELEAAKVREGETED